MRYTSSHKKISYLDKTDNQNEYQDGYWHDYENWNESKHGKNHYHYHYHSSTSKGKRKKKDKGKYGSKKYRDMYRQYLDYYLLEDEYWYDFREYYEELYKDEQDYQAEYNDYFYEDSNYNSDWSFSVEDYSGDSFSEYDYQDGYWDIFRAFDETSTD